jgi:hypothetical protein
MAVATIFSCNCVGFADLQLILVANRSNIRAASTCKMLN